jgi:hypothetical protein
VLRYIPENRSSPRVVTGKWLLKYEKLTTRLKNKTWKTWTNQQMKMAMNSCDQTTDTTQKS